jgi:hypothetical protein
MCSDARERDFDDAFLRRAAEFFRRAQRTSRGCRPAKFERLRTTVGCAQLPPPSRRAPSAVTIAAPGLADVGLSARMTVANAKLAGAVRRHAKKIGDHFGVVSGYVAAKSAGLGRARNASNRLLLSYSRGWPWPGYSVVSSIQVKTVRRSEASDKSSSSGVLV